MIPDRYMTRTVSVFREQTLTTWDMELVLGYTEISSLLNGKV
jgi:hypothetical protein